MSSFRRSAGSSDEEKMAKIPHMVDFLFFYINGQLAYDSFRSNEVRPSSSDALESAGTGARGSMDDDGWGLKSGCGGK